MASHDSTPRAILDDTPSPTVTVVSPQHGYSRSERRYGIAWPKYDPPERARSLMALSDTAARKAGRNVPHVRTTPRRGKNVRRHASPRSRALAGTS